MQKVILYFSIIFLGTACGQNNSVHKATGYVVYILPNNIRFVETMRMPDVNYATHFNNKNFKRALSFKPNCEIGKLLEDIKVDTLFDENPELKEYTTFMKQPLIFPAEITIADTAKGSTQQDPKKFKMILNGKEVSFRYKELNNGVVINLRRID